MTNNEFAHKFFYCEDSKYRTYKNMHFDSEGFYSYATKIARVYETKNGEKITLLSDNHFSSTTANHIRFLRMASPYPVIYVPGLQYGSPHNLGSNLKQILEENFISVLDYASELNFGQVKNRDFFEHIFRNYEKFLRTFSLGIPKIKYRKVIQLITNDERVKEYKKRQREKAATQAKKDKKIVTDFMKTHNYLDCVKIFTQIFYEKTIDHAVIQSLRKVFAPWTYAYIYPVQNEDTDENMVKTSKGLIFKAEAVKTWLKAWLKGELKHGMKIDCYTIMSITDKAVKIGCHNIPTKNLHELAKYYGLE